MRAQRESMMAQTALIVGCGRLGSHLATRLDGEGCCVHVVDRDSASFRSLPDHLEGSCFAGDPIDPQVLLRAGIEEAAFLITVSSLDDLNAAVALVGRRVFGVRHVLARIGDPNRAASYRMLGIETVCATPLVAAALLNRIAWVALPAGCGPA
jgi:trk/ktr system potassium uptake protein